MKSKQRDSDPTIQDVLDAMNAFSTHVDDEFAEVKTDMRDMKIDIHDLKIDISDIRTDISDINGEMTGVKASMVTKDYLDDKLADLKGEIYETLRSPRWQNNLTN